jgi:hypothetical protein
MSFDYKQSIDFLITCHEKDFPSLNLCINGIKKNISNLNNIFVISNKNPNIQDIIYISEDRYKPYIDIQKIIENFELQNSNFTYRSGWIYQQFLKLFSAKVIPELTDSYVIVDSDTIFIKPILFDPEKFYYCKADEYHIPYITSIKNILGIEKTIGFSTISHHMIFHKKILNEMIESVEKRFNSNLFFDCVLDSINYNEISTLSEWDLYSNYILINHPGMCEHRQLIWENIPYIPNVNEMVKNIDFVSCHSYLREPCEPLIMSNYVHCHLGEVPSYLIDSFMSIDEVEPSARLILITDQNIEIDGIEVLNHYDIASEQTLKVLNMSLFSSDENLLWRTSIFRVFLVRDCMKYLNLKNCYHFDSDVLLFEPSSKFEHLIKDSDGLSVTYHTEDEIVFGFSKFGDINKIDEICDILCDIVFDEQKQKEYASIMPNEMQLLGGIYKRRPDLIKRLNVFPNDDEIVFDPSSYGQYLGGTNNGHSSGWYGDHHVVGREIGKGILHPVFTNNKPYVEKDDKKYPLVNLHIHSKDTERFTLHINSDVNLNLEEIYPGVEMLPYERYKLYTWVSQIIKPTNVLDVGCGSGGGTYYISEGMKTCKSRGKIYSCDPGRGPSEEFLMRQNNVDYSPIYSTDLITQLVENNIKIDYIFFDGPEDPDIAMRDIISLENYILPGCYFSMHDWEVVPRKYDGQISTKSIKIREYMEYNSSVWQPVEILEGSQSSDSVGLCLYKFLGR